MHDLRSKEIAPARDVSLTELIDDPRRVVEVPSARVVTLVAELAAKQAALTALQSLLAARLLTAGDAPTRPAEIADRLLTAADVAKMLGVTCRWVQRRARRLPFARRLSEHAIRYSEAGLKRWMTNRHVSAA